MPKLDAKALRRLHIASDCVLVALGWIAAYGLRHALNDVLGTPINPIDWYVRALPIVVVPWVFSCWLFGIYRSSRMHTVVEELQTLFRGVTIGLLAVATIGFFFKELEFGRLVVLVGAGFNLVTQGVSRVCFHRLGRRLRRSGAADVSTLILGTGVVAIRLLQKLQDHPETGYRVIGFLDESVGPDAKDVAGRPVLGSIESLREIAVANRVEEVFVALPSLGHTEMLSLVLDCEDLGITFRCVTNLFEVLTAGTQIDLVDDLPLVRLGRDRIHPLYEPCKRVFDVCGALIGMLVTAPLLLACALRIRATSPGPALFVHERVGRNGRCFQLYKFRTMLSDADPSAAAPCHRDDARVTPTGRWLRRASLDELPQLWNVLRGDMSLVGPRPEMPFIVDTYDAWQRRRLAVKPGITGLWQILGRKDLPMHENLQYDFYYIRNRSLGLDASILIRTIGAVLSGRGAF